jgi:hypothetical protein
VTYTRFATRAATPVLWLLWRLGIVGREYWNLCVGAWNPHQFSPRWHFVHFGDPIPSLPEEVVLAGIGYTTHVHEGIVVFKSDAFFASRIQFERDEHDAHADLWYVSVGSRAVPAVHVEQAYEWVCGVFGGSHQKRVTP